MTSTLNAVFYFLTPFFMCATCGCSGERMDVKVDAGEDQAIPAELLNKVKEDPKVKEAMDNIAKMA